jgi:thiol-disulfide isomerase/thioredoxin
MKPFPLIITGLLLLPPATFAKTPSAEEVLAPAKAKAFAENKTIFVHFGASWCGWCRKLDAFLEQAEIKPVFERYFVPVKLVVEEKEKNKDLENPGAESFLKKLGGPAGLPYSAFLDSHGKMIVNSKQGGANIGYPAQPAEIDWFIEMIKKAAPRITSDDLKTIENALRNEKKT